MPEWVVAMFMIGLVLVVRDMAKTVFEARRSRREVAVYDNHPQKVRMERYADSFQSLADTFYRMPRKREHLTRIRWSRSWMVREKNCVNDARRLPGAGNSTTI